MEAKNVSFGKPRIGGAIFAAPLGTKLPVTATDVLDKGFLSLGYVNEDGLTNEDARDTENIRAWGGDVVLVIQKEKTDTFTFTLIESLNINVLKQIYGETNVTGNLESGITIKSTSTPLEPHSLVIDMIFKGGILKRIVIPNATVSEVGEIPYNDDDPVGYETTLTCVPDSEGVTHYEYIQKSVN